MNPSLEKTCTLCGMDLNGQKRVKNSAGEYFCPDCWETHNSIFGESSDVVNQTSTAKVMVSPPSAIRASIASPTVRIVRSDLEPTLAQAALQGAKAGVRRGLFRTFRKATVTLQFIVVIGVTKKFFPETNNGVVAILALTSAIAGILEVDLIARAMKIDDIWIDAETLKCRGGVIGIIGFALAYAIETVD
jgi:hypothetical protein